MSSDFFVRGQFRSFNIGIPNVKDCMDINSLIEETLELRKKSYAPFSRFRVASILLTKDGKKYKGVNVEISSFGLTICAERVALFSAIADGEREFSAIFVASDSEKITSPCGACRQVIWELAGDIEVFMINKNGEFEKFHARDLLPHGFDSSYLKIK